MRKLWKRIPFGLFGLMCLMGIGVNFPRKCSPTVEVKTVVVTKVVTEVVPEYIYVPVPSVELPHYEIAHPVRYPHNAEMMAKLKALSRYPALEWWRLGYVKELKRTSTLLCG